MALRQKICQFQPAIAGSLEEHAVIPRVRQPVSVGFRTGVDLGEVVQTIATNPRVLVDAAVGSGKSTRLPLAIAEGMGVLVLHVLPNEYIVRDISEYLESQGKSVMAITSVHGEYPDVGVALIPAAVLVARWLASGVVAFPRCVLYHDESHESDAYTYLVRTLAAACDNLISYVAASGTHQANGFRVQETPEKLVSKSLPVVDFEADWDLGDVTKPWAVANIVDNVLIYEDDPARARSLVEQYSLAGFSAYRLHSRMDPDMFRSAMRAARNPRNSITVLVADYAFRSALTVPLSVIIDTAKVRECDTGNGYPIWAFRPAYLSERHQSAGRGSRIKGKKSVYYQPDDVAPSRICDLVATEVEAAALMLRLLGYNVPLELQEAVMSSGSVPRNLVSALQGQAPLALLKADDKVSLPEFYTPSGRRSPYLREDVQINPDPMDLDPRVSADTARKYGRSSLIMGTPPVEAPRPLRPANKLRVEHDEYDRDAILARGGRVTPYSAERRDSGYGEVLQVQDYVDAVESLVGYEDAVESLEIGKYYYAVGVVTTKTVSPAFPDGADSVLKMISRDKSESLQLGWSLYNRGVAVSALVTRYNVRTCEFRVLTSAIAEAKKRGSGKDRGALRQWATVLSERMTYVLTDIQLLGKFIMRLTADFCGLAVMAPMMQEEQMGYQRVMRELDALPEAGVGPSKDQMDSFRSEWAAGRVLGSISSDEDGLGAADDWSRADQKLRTVRMPVVGKGMRALPASNNPFLWLAGGSASAHVVRDKPKLMFQR